VIELCDIGFRAGDFSLEKINLRVPRGSYSVLMGRTGSGKTTLLEIICGLRASLSGRVLLDGRDVTREPPGARGIGYVPQDGALFPTMTVRAQLGFALRMKRRPSAEIEQSVCATAAQLGIEPLLNRLPHDLSGGEKQRVALGRALAARPAVLLLDEPLSALDEELRDELAALLKTVQREHALTALHVTHSRGEAAQIADTIFLLEAGEIRADARQRP
jgi:ABC-type sugar transport system ATPase subunit